MSEITQKKLLIEPHYLPCWSWMALAARHEIICFDLGEYPLKSSYRNRCRVLGPNGVLTLSIPLQHGRGHKLTTGELCIAYEQNWQKVHWATLTSCYRRSPNFEFFEDLLAPLYHRRYERLIDFQIALLDILFKWLRIRTEIQFSTTYIPAGTPGFFDARNSIRPGKLSPLQAELPSYTQVFSDRFDFFEDLSIIDMMCNQGKIAFN